MYKLMKNKVIISMCLFLGMSQLAYAKPLKEDKLMLTGIYLGAGAKGSKWLGPVWRVETAGKNTVKLKHLKIFGGGLRHEQKVLPERIGDGSDFDPTGILEALFCGEIQR